MSEVEDARAALMTAVSAHAFENGPAGDVGLAADAYGDARELRGHVGACEKVINYGVKNETLSSPGHTRCGDGWYCPDAPVKEVTHDDD